jgi:K+-sensing histidine kinase KdpD
MVRRIIDTFGGSIDVESRTGLGSRFTLRFPAAEPAPRGPQEALTADHSKWAAETDDW